MKTYKEITEDDGFKRFCHEDILKLEGGYFLLPVYELLHKTREAINREKKISITINYANIVIHRPYDMVYLFEDYNDSEEEALAQALWFIYKETK